MLDKSPKKIIFLHLIGSHYKYHYRYPSNFDIFKSKKSSKKGVGTSQYHNTILYTDHILNLILNELKSLNTNSYLLYFSDHGEDVTDDPKSVHGHVDSPLSTPAMFNIPFVVWTSDKYKELNSKFIKNWNVDKVYKTKNLIHSITNLSRLESDKCNKNKSIFENNP